MHIFYDPDEWESVFESTPCTSCRGDMRRCNGMCNGAASWSQRQRAPEEVAKIKQAKRLAHEEAVLAEAVEIIARRRVF